MNGASPVVDAATVAGLVADGAAVLDVRWSLGGPPGREAFAAGHLLGAQHVDLEHDLADPPGERGRHPLPDPDRFGAAMRRAGVSHDRAVVVLDQRDSLAAARLWWLLVHHGHDDVRVLDGGHEAWVAAGGLTTGLATSVPAGDFRPTPRPDRAPVLDADGAAALARAGLLLDARPAARYRGEVEPVDPVAGHVPGALSAPGAEMLQPDGRWRPPAALRDWFAARGVDATTAGGAGAYCGSGVIAAQTLLGLVHAGLVPPAGPLPALYPGSWSEWVADPRRPVATGPAPG